MNELEKRFDEEIERRKFDFFEIQGFQSKPKLALKAGMAMGYLLACDIISDKLNPTAKSPPTPKAQD